MQNQRNGLTLAELVVGFCALGTLLSLSLPAIQLGREGARGVVCQQNLQIIGLASLDYDDAFGELPPYMGVPTNQHSISGVLAMARNYQLTYSLTQLLDFVGYSDLTEQVDPFAFSNFNATIQSVGYNVFDDWQIGMSPELPGIAAITFDLQFPEFRCPVDSEAPRNAVIVGPHPTNSGSPAVLFPTPTKSEYSVTNYVANVGAIFFTDTPFNSAFEGSHGPIRSRRSDSAATIPDGASNVILFGESLGEIFQSPEFNINRRYSMAMGGLACGRASIYFSPNGSPNFGTMTRTTYVQFASGHPDVVNFVFADGSVRSLNRNIRNRVISSLCGVADGEPALDLTGN